MTYYVLKGDIAEYDYQVFGVFNNLKQLKQAAEDIIAIDFATAEKATNDYGFSGLVYCIIHEPNQKQAEEKHEIYWNTKEAQAYF